MEQQQELLKLLTEEINDYEFLDWRPNVFTNTQRVESAIHDGLLEKTWYWKTDVILRAAGLQAVRS